MGFQIEGSIISASVGEQQSSGVARPGPTRACALPAIFQALPSPNQQESHDSITN